MCDCVVAVTDTVQQVARGISNASVHLANNLAEWKGQLLTRLSTQQAAAKQRMTSEHVVVDTDAKQVYVAGLMIAHCGVRVCSSVLCDQCVSLYMRDLCRASTASTGPSSLPLSAVWPCRQWRGP